MQNYLEKIEKSSDEEEDESDHEGPQIDIEFENEETSNGNFEHDHLSEDVYDKGFQPLPLEKN